MIRRIVQSMMVIAMVASMAAYTSYAAFTSNEVTIQASSVTTGSANMAICYATGANTWKGLIAPSLAVTDLVPGDTVGKNLTAGKDLYIGNDNGSLPPVLGSGICNSYDGAFTPGSSDVTLNIVPKVTSLSCPSTLPGEISIALKLDGSTVATDTLTGWSTNTTSVGSFAPGATRKIEMTATLNSSATDQNTTCTFDFVFGGSSV